MKRVEKLGQEIRRWLWLCPRGTFSPDIHAVCGVWDMRYGTISNFGKFGGTSDINFKEVWDRVLTKGRNTVLSFCKIRETD